MSLYSKKSSLLTVRPKIIESNDVLIIRQNYIVRIVSLFLSIRSVKIFPKQKILVHKSRLCYLWSQDTIIPFDKISHIDYKFGDFGTSYGCSGKNDSVEVYTISVTTTDDLKYKICSYRGEGAVCTGWTGVLLDGDSINDYSGTQDTESRNFVNYLCKILNTQLGPKFNRA